MAVKREVRIITPDVASELLATINVNRDPTQSYEDLHVRQMQDGLWEDAITIVYINDRGELVDCAKRLRALKRANYTGEWLVISGVPADAQDKMDRNEVRTVAQDLQMRKVKYANDVGALARVIYDLKERDSRGIGKGFRPPPFRVVELAMRHREEMEASVPAAKRLKKKLPALNLPVTGAAYWLLHQNHPDFATDVQSVKLPGLATRFFKDLEFPPHPDDAPGNPGRLLHNYMTQYEEYPPTKNACFWLILTAFSWYKHYDPADKSAKRMNLSAFRYPNGKKSITMADIPRLDSL